MSHAAPSTLALPSRRSGGVEHSRLTPTPELLRSSGFVTMVGDAPVRHLAFGDTASDVTPVIIFGGAFQTFWSFRNEASRLAERWPVILVELPGQGSNTGDSAALDLDDLADLSAGFLGQHGIDQVVPLGLSYGSAIAHRFATRFPELTERLILGGVAPRLQPSLQRLLSVTRWLLDEGRIDAWAWGCVLHLVNVEAQRWTGLRDEVLVAFQRSLARLPEEARERWWTNTRRLLATELTEAPMCPTLVFGCRYDDFMPPFQAAEVARVCPDVRFALFTHADHLAPLERPDDVLDLYEAFLDGRPIESGAHLLVDEEAFGACEDRRVDHRAPATGTLAIEVPGEGERQVAIRDIGPQGVRVEPGAPFPPGPAPLRVRLDAQGVTTLAVPCPDAEGDRLRFFYTDPRERMAWVAAVEVVSSRATAAAGAA